MVIKCYRYNAIARALDNSLYLEPLTSEYLKRVTMSNETDDRVLIEGFLGELGELGFVEDAMLEIKGANGILRLDLKDEEFKKLLPKGRVKEESLK